MVTWQGFGRGAGKLRENNPRPGNCRRIARAHGTLIAYADDRMREAWTSVVETPAYLADAEKLLSENERSTIITLVAQNPQCGDVMAGTGGFRKVRVAVGDRGKSGGARVIYYFYNQTAPVFLMAVFAKNEKENLSKAERNALAKVAKSIVASLSRR